MSSALFVAPFAVVPLAILATTIWIVERRLRPNAIAPSKRLLVYFAACLLAAIGPAWLLAKVYGLTVAVRRPDAPGFWETWGMLTLGLSSVGALALAMFDRARSVWLHRQWMRRADPYAARSATGSEDEWWRGGR